ncbi:E3 ubiquitin-protein ligase PUB22-like [Benincasa hispida]|uniref:E3 ubiquitin-protein ligase PUB22-like n=1 Tax=Benincasa hispida TaxID=102211 RepID=UPI001902C161|nr:E3 ubiquitin-protein ligase PUB22-like [Benincasa hispida]
MAELDQEVIDPPPFFLCPISLQIMKDPVTIASGITYDRENIEKWLFSDKHKTCPVSKVVLLDFDITPNHTLRRVIQAWCTANATSGVERIPTPKPPVDRKQVVRILADAKLSPFSQQNCLRRLRSIAAANETNKRCMEAAGVVEFLAGLVCSSTTNVESGLEDYAFDDMSANLGDEALSILYKLQISESSLKFLLSNNGGIFISTLTKILQNRSYSSRAYSIMLLNSMFEVADQIQILNLTTDFFIEIVQILKDQISKQASKSALKLLIGVCSSIRNRVKAVEAGAVPVLVDLLLDLDSSEKRLNEMILVVLDLLCGCADGRAGLLNHAAGIAVVSKKILRVSSLGSEKAVGILCSVARFSASQSVLQEMVRLGVVTKLCFLLQVVGAGVKAKEKAKEILKLHGRTWRNSSCLPSSLRSAYPQH